MKYSINDDNNQLFHLKYSHLLNSRYKEVLLVLNMSKKDYSVVRTIQKDMLGSQGSYTSTIVFLMTIDHSIHHIHDRNDEK